MTYREEFSTLGEMLAATVVFARESDHPDRRLAMQAVAGMGGQSGTAGGFLIPDEFGSEIWQRATNVGQILRRCARQPVSKKFGRLCIPAVSENSRGDGSRYGGLRLAWLDQGDPFPESKPALGQIKFDPKKVGGIVATSDELLEDVPALDEWFSRIASRELAFDVEDAIVNGNGVGKPLGVLNSPSLIVVEKDEGQDPDQYSVANLRNMVRRLWPGSFANAVWLMGVDAFGAILTLNDSDGSLLGRDTDGNRTLLEFPIVMTESTPPLSEVGDIILADLGEYLVAEREAGTNVLSSIHVRFINDETAFRIAARIDGAPAWASPVTIKNAERTVSPFIALESR